jgi:hypothetical protein
MTPELAKYYEQRLDLMAHPGWKDLMEDVSNMLAATDRVSIVKDDKDLWFKKGEISMMNWMLTAKDVAEESYRQLKEDENS